MNSSDSPVTSTDTDIIIVGCGPVGATLALLLAKHGVSTVLLDREKSIYPLPRAVHFDDQIMRVFQSIGIADELEKVTRYNPGMRFVDPQGTLLLDWPRPSGTGNNGWHSSYRFHQPDLETLLRDQLQNTPCSQLIVNAQVTDVHQVSNYAVVEFANRETGQREQLSAHYVIGCDGANSIVRQFINDDVHDLGFNEKWIVVDVLLKADKPKLGDFTIQHCGGKRPATYVRGPLNRRRWEISLSASDDVDTIATTNSIWELLSRWLTPEEATIERSAIYEFKSMVAKQWRDRRLFLAGDAAHLTPPFMGQGMCAGIRDVSNLAWKLALSIENSNKENSLTDHLLNSYQDEREPNVKEYIKTAIGLGVLLNSCSTKESLEEAFPNTNGVVQMRSIVPRLGKGLLAGSDDLQGEWFPQPVLSNGRRLDDYANKRAVLLIDSELQLEFQSLNKSELQELPVLFSGDEPEIAVLLAELCTKAVLLRPDYYLMGSAGNAEELKSMLLSASSIFARTS